MDNDASQVKRGSNKWRLHEKEKDESKSLN